MGNFKEDIARCEAFVFDVDGVMTDGGIIPTPDGDFIRRYNAKDGYALAYAIKIGYKVCIITGGRGRTLENRLRMLGIDHFYVDCMDKITAIREYMAGQGLDPANVIYMGDDIPDLDCMREVGLPVCPADAAADALRRYIETYRVPGYDEKTRRGLLRHLYIRTNQAGQSLICVLVNGKKLPHEPELVSLLRQAVPETVGVVLGVNTQPTGAILGGEYRTLWGEDVLTDRLCGLTFRLSVPSFYQVNHDMAEVLYRTALDFAGLTGTETVLDLYCGAGTITQVMARRAGRVIGAEIVPAAIEDARENARRNGIGNVEFFCGDASAVAADFAARGLRPDVICVDPPRKGLSPDVVSAAAQMQPRRIVYVSCDPATLARDVKLFAQEGYGAVRAAAVDMFPGTANIESVVRLERAK